MDHPLLTLANEEESLRTQELEDLESYLHGSAESPLLYRCGYMTKAADDSETMEFIASEESEDRFGDIIEVDGWQLANFRRNPVFLWAHDSRTPPVGRVTKVGPSETGRQLLASVKWDMDDPFAAMIQSKYANRFMRAVSVGFRPLEFNLMDKGGIRFTKQDLLELSAVPVPAHPKALRKAFEREVWAMKVNYPATNGNSAIVTVGAVDTAGKPPETISSTLAYIFDRLDKLERLLEQPNPDIVLPPQAVTYDTVRDFENLFALVATKE